MKTFLHDRHEQVNDHGDPDLRLHGVGRGPVERFDLQMLFDPFEEQFDLPLLPIRVRDHLRWNIEEVRQEHETFLLLGIGVGDSSQRLWITGPGLVTDQGDDLVPSHSPRSFGSNRRETMEPQIALCPDDEERRQKMNRIETREVDVPRVHGNSPPGMILGGWYPKWIGRN